MDEIQRSSENSQSQDCDSSFSSLHLSGNQPEEMYEDIFELSNLEFAPQKSLRQSVQQTFKVCKSGLRTIKTNLAYSLKHSKFDVFTKREKVILDKNQSITLLGKTYKGNSKQKQQFYIEFNNTIWLTYRNGIEGVQSDAGWGCMIRVCQMLLAETFKRISPQTPLKRIIQHFKDTSTAYFSLTKICQTGNIHERWTSSIQIVTVLKNLLFQFKQIILNIQIHSGCIQIQSLKQLQTNQYPALVFISNRLGKNCIELEYKYHLFELMKISSFLGAVGGNGGQALYLIGNYNDRIIFLDPHYVQSSEYQTQNTSTYFQSQPYSIDVCQLAPSIAFAFLVKSKQDYQELVKQIYVLQLKYGSYSCLQVHSQQLFLNIRKPSEKEDQFQVI